MNIIEYIMNNEQNYMNSNVERSQSEIFFPWKNKYAFIKHEHLQIPNLQVPTSSKKLSKFVYYLFNFTHR